MAEHADEMVAVGEVGLPYYARLEAESEGRPWDNRPYAYLLEQFIAFAKKHHKPVILHAVYEDADIACDLLENTASLVPIFIGLRAPVTPYSGWQITDTIFPLRPTSSMRKKFVLWQVGIRIISS